MDEAWNAVEALLPDDGKMGVETKYVGISDLGDTYEAWAKVGVKSLGFGYGFSPEEALTKLAAKMAKDAGG